MHRYLEATLYLISGDQIHFFDPYKVQLPSKRSSALIHLTDWFPTLLSMAEISPPTDLQLDGIDQSNLFLESEPTPSKGFNIFDILNI